MSMWWTFPVSLALTAYVIFTPASHERYLGGLFRALVRQVERLALLLPERFR
jgi:hypothetical protein